MSDADDDAAGKGGPNEQQASKPEGGERAQGRARLLVDIVSDPVCPWCYVGLISFQHARDQLADTFQVLPRIRAYQLNPDTPLEGVDRAAHYARKFPDETQRAQMAHALKAAAAGAGFKFDPMAPTRLPNTLRAHQLIRFAHYNGAQERLARLIYDAYWNRDADIGDVEALAGLAEEAGLDADHVRELLASEANAAELKAEADSFRAAGVTGVPTFIVNERTGFSGALPPARLADALKEAAAQTTLN